MLDGSVMLVGGAACQALVRPPPRQARPSCARLLVRAEGDPPALAAKPALRPPPPRPQPPAARQIAPSRPRDAQQGDGGNWRGGGRGRGQGRAGDDIRNGRNGRDGLQNGRPYGASTDSVAGDGKTLNVDPSPTANGAATSSASSAASPVQAPAPPAQAESQAAPPTAAEQAAASAEHPTASERAASPQHFAAPSTNGAVAAQIAEARPPRSCIQKPQSQPRRSPQRLQSRPHCVLRRRS